MKKTVLVSFSALVFGVLGVLLQVQANFSSAVSVSRSDTIADATEFNLDESYQQVFSFLVENNSDNGVSFSSLKFKVDGPSDVSENPSIKISRDNENPNTNVAVEETLVATLGTEQNVSASSNTISSSNPTTFYVFLSVPEKNPGDYQFHLTDIVLLGDGQPEVYGSETAVLSADAPVSSANVKFVSKTASVSRTDSVADETDIYIDGDYRNLFSFSVENNRESDAINISEFQFKITGPDGVTEIPNVKIQLASDDTEMIAETSPTAFDTQTNAAITATTGFAIAAGDSSTYDVLLNIPGRNPGDYQFHLTGVKLQDYTSEAVHRVNDNNSTTPLANTDSGTVSSAVLNIISNFAAERTDTFSATNTIFPGTTRTVFVFKVQNTTGENGIGIKELNFATTLAVSEDVTIRLLDSDGATVDESTISTSAASFDLGHLIDAGTNNAKTYSVVADFPADFSSTSFQLNLQGVEVDSGDEVVSSADYATEIKVASPIFGTDFEVSEPVYAVDELIVIYDSNEADDIVANAFNTLTGNNAFESISKNETFNFEVFQTPAESDLDALIESLAGTEGIQSIQKNYVYKLASSASPNDLSLPNQWAVENTGQNVNGATGTDDADVDLAEAWEQQDNANGIRVAVLDSGAQVDHEDLAGNIVAQKDIVDESDSVTDVDTTNGHGTHVAGIIGAVGNNAIGIAGVAQDVGLMIANVFQETADGSLGATTTDVIAGIEWAAENHAQIINMSLGMTDEDTLLEETIESYTNILFVAASGNGDEDGNGINQDSSGAVKIYPASFDSANILSVAATDQNDALASFSNYGTTSVDVAAPGVNIYSTLPGDDYGYLNGTSMAAPLVAGIAALMLAEDPSLSVADLKNILIDTSDSISDLNNSTVSGGRVNANAALTSVNDQNKVKFAAADDSPAADTEILADQTPQTVFKFTATNDSGATQNLTEIKFKITKTGDYITDFPTVDFQNGTTIVKTDNTAGTTFGEEYTYSVEDTVSATDGSNVNTYSVLLTFPRGNAGGVQFDLTGVTLENSNTAISGASITGNTLDLNAEVVAARTDEIAEGTNYLSGEIDKSVLSFSVENNTDSAITATDFSLKILGDSAEGVNLKIFDGAQTPAEIGTIDSENGIATSDGVQSIDITDQEIAAGATANFSITADFPAEFTDAEGDTFQLQLTDITFSNSSLSISRDDDATLSDENPVGGAVFDLLPTEFSVSEFTPTPEDTTVTTSPTVEGKIDGNFDLTDMDAVITVSGNFNNDPFNSATKYDVVLDATNRTFSQNLVEVVGGDFAAFESGEPLEITVGLSRNGTSKEMSETGDPHQITPASDFPDDFQVLNFLPAADQSVISTKPVISGEFENSFNINGITAAVAVAFQKDGSNTTFYKYNIDIDDNRYFSQDLAALVAETDSAFTEFTSGAEVAIAVGFSENQTQSSTTWSESFGSSGTLTLIPNTTPSTDADFGTDFSQNADTVLPVENESYTFTNTGSLVSSSDANLKVEIPANATISKDTEELNTWGGELEIPETITNPSSSLFSNFTPEKTISVGFDAMNLNWDANVTIQIPVDSGNGTEMEVYSSADAGSTWTKESNTCTVADGFCRFETDHFTQFTVGTVGTTSEDPEEDEEEVISEPIYRGGGGGQNYMRSGNYDPRQISSYIWKKSEPNNYHLFDRTEAEITPCDINVETQKTAHSLKSLQWKFGKKSNCEETKSSATSQKFSMPSLQQ